MKQGYEYSKSLAVLSALAICSTISMAWLREEDSAKWAFRLRDIERLTKNGEDQVAARSKCDDSDLATLRMRVGRFRLLLGSGDTERLVSGLFGKSWAAEPTLQEDRDGYSIQLSGFSMISPTLDDWQKAVSTLGTLEGLPGVGIARFSMRTSGETELRNVDELRVLVEIRSCGPKRGPVKP
jgi:hypothetical protein